MRLPSIRLKSYRNAGESALGSPAAFRPNTSRKRSGVQKQILMLARSPRSSRSCTPSKISSAPQNGIWRSDPGEYELEARALLTRPGGAYGLRRASSRLPRVVAGHEKLLTKRQA